MQLRGSSLTSWFTLCSLSLCCKELLKSQGICEFGGREGCVDYRVQCRVLEQLAWRRLVGWLTSAAEACVGGA